MSNPPTPNSFEKYGLPGAVAVTRMVSTPLGLELVKATAVAEVAPLARAASTATDSATAAPLLRLAAPASAPASAAFTM